MRASHVRFGSKADIWPGTKKITAGFKRQAAIYRKLATERAKKLGLPLSVPPEAKRRIRSQSKDALRSQRAPILVRREALLPLFGFWLYDVVARGYDRDHRDNQQSGPECIHCCISSNSHGHKLEDPTFVGGTL